MKLLLEICQYYLMKFKEYPEYLINFKDKSKDVLFDIVSCISHLSISHQESINMKARDYQFISRTRSISSYLHSDKQRNIGPYVIEKLNNAIDLNKENMKFLEEICSRKVTVE